MTTKEIIKLFFSTLLMFILGFVLLLTIETTIEIKSLLFYTTTRAIIMILSGIILYFITNWKSLRLKKQLLYEKKHKEFIKYIKLRGIIVAIFTLISIYYSRKGFKNNDFVYSILDMVNKLYFHKEYSFYILKFNFVSTSITTLFFTLIMITTYVVLEFFFTRRNNR
ncbi:MAG: hypothetical protein PHE29_06330 [Tissierellia bacterium]|nr:hypothetical protein [Tissierellia bacterium]